MFEYTKFPSPYRGYHLSTGTITFLAVKFNEVSVPLSGLSSFNAKATAVCAVIGLFPSPYRGYHLSTYGDFADPSKNTLQWFPSPYRGYHLSTLKEVSQQDGKNV